MKTKTIELYEFSELSEKAKEKVLDKCRHINTDYDGWCDFELEDWKIKLEGMGFSNPEISYSGFYSQGDGASFTSKNVDVEKFARSQRVYGRFKTLINAINSERAYFSADIYRTDHHYSHYNTIGARSDWMYYGEKEKEENAISKLAGEFEAAILDVAKKLSKQIYSDLESCYEGLTSDEAVIDAIESSEYTFKADGTMENE